MKLRAHWVLGLLVSATLAGPAKPIQADEAEAVVLPSPSVQEAGPIGLTVEDVPLHVFQARTPPAKAPNVVIILLDDVGFAASETFGGLIETPHLDAMAADGLRYNRFHTTGICSPTRASLLTGRNPHAAGVGAVINSAQPHPGRAGLMEAETATVAEILRQHGYATSMWGKWHLVPDHEASPTGPFDRWPTGMGFETFYGFLGGETHQFEPTLHSGTQPVRRPEGDDYHITEDLTDRAIAWMRMEKALRPDQPFFLYLAPGATHAPLHAPKEWIDRYRGRFDQGWDALREDILVRQKELGLVPEDTLLTPRPDELRAWESLDPKEKKIAARLMEVYAGFLTHTDAQVGRLLTALREMNAYDETLIFYIVGDNGGSGEGGGDYGTYNEMGRIQGVVQSPDELLERIDTLGGPDSYPHYSAGWGWATNTPFQWVKQVASHLGATRTPMVVSWPNGIQGKGELRSQFSHVNDITPTILEAVGLAAPAQVNGVTQKPMDGQSLVYTFNEPEAEERHQTQYFEVLANVSLYHQGWMLSGRNRARVPWGRLTSRADETEAYAWELYDLRTDFSQARDLADTHPEELSRLQNLFWAEAGRNQVLPLSGRPAGQKPFPALGEGRSQATYSAGAIGLHESAVPDLKNIDHRVVAEIVVPEEGAQGVIAALGGVVAGWSLYINEEGQPAYTYNLFGKTRTTVRGPEPLPPGPAKLEFLFDYDGGGAGRGADLELQVNGKRVAQGRLEASVPAFFSIDETFDVGTDMGSAAGEYDPHFAFNGEIKRVTLQREDN